MQTAATIALAQRVPIARRLAALAGRLAAFTEVGRRYDAAASPVSGGGFAARALRELDIPLRLEAGDLARVPAEGPLVVVANHPYGAIDGLAALDLLARVRPDVKVLANYLLKALPPLRTQLIAIDPFGSRSARAGNAAALREAGRWLRSGGCLVVFPAGEVAHELRDGLLVDGPWRSAAARLATSSHAPVLPLWFAGGNSTLFRLAGRLHPLLRTLLLPREMWRRRRQPLTVRIGDVVHPRELVSRRAGDATAHLRARTEALARRREAVPVVAQGDAAAIAANVAALVHARLVESGRFEVYCATADRLPAVLPEIGRLRELTFRAAGEGTGRSCDLDRFDLAYQHLFVWDRERGAVAGAYRLRTTDGLGQGGAAELYTHTLFRFGQPFLDALGPAIELGRSFVAPPYQRDYSPLLLLWKGIGRLMAQSGGRYHRLFGAVSVSRSYSPASRQAIAATLSACRAAPSLAALVHPRRAPEPETGPSVPFASIEALGAAVRTFEPDGKDLPVLLRQYLRLEARTVGWSVDPGFADALDGLMVVELEAIPARLRARVLGTSVAGPRAA